nr:endonuclease domain-containing protein [Candidatus Cloacimonadota bacterium]
ALKERRRELRNNQTPEEKMLWQKIHKKHLSGIQFYRQYGIGAYIADFYAPSLRLCVEVDGEQHYTKTGEQYDAERDNFMESLNIKVPRFKNELVIEDTDDVVNEIKRAIKLILDSEK